MRIVSCLKFVSAVKWKCFRFLVIWLLANTSFAQNSEQITRINSVRSEPGLIAFWDFYKTGNHTNLQTWDSYFDPALANAKTFPIYLRKAKVDTNFGLNNWNFSTITKDQSGPFGNGVLFDRGFIYGQVPRSEFEGTPLNISGNSSFTIIAWLKYTGNGRHGVAGVWDEGDWSPYSGRRQFALFSGLEGQSKSHSMHISATGSATYPQSTAPDPYAREIAFNGKDVEDNEWHALGATYDYQTKKLTCYLDGIATESYRNQPVAQEVYRYMKNVADNPLQFDWPIYDPRAFILKFTGYDIANEQEHWVYVDLKNFIVKYGQRVTSPGAVTATYKVRLIIKRNGEIILPGGMTEFLVNNGTGSATLPVIEYKENDVVEAYLYKKDEQGNYIQIERPGFRPSRTLAQGAPFVIGRASGNLLAEPEHGTSAYFDGIAVFNKALSSQKMRELSFIPTVQNSYIQSVKGSNQLPAANGYSQEIEVTCTGTQLLQGTKLRFTYQGMSVTKNITDNPQKILLTNIPYFSGRFTEWEWMKVELLNSSDNILDTWNSRRVFPAPRTSADLITSTVLVSQSISFPALQQATLGTGPLTLQAVSSSGLPVMYSSSNTAVATINGNQVILQGIGTTLISASQAGNSMFAAAVPVTQLLTVVPSFPLCTNSIEVTGNKTYTSSSVGWGHLPTDAFDAQLNTRWESGSSASGEWLMINLQSKYSLCRTTINWVKYAYPSSFKIESSIDGINWQMIDSKTNYDGSVGNYQYVLDVSSMNILSNYVRIVCIQPAPGTWGGSYSINEWNISGLPAQSANSSARVAAERNTITETQVSMFPNPVDEVLTVLLPDFKDKVKIVVSDSVGKIVLEQEVIEIKFDLKVHQLRPGNYTLTASNNQKTIVTRFIKK